MTSPWRLAGFAVLGAVGLLLLRDVLGRPAPQPAVPPPPPGLERRDPDLGTVEIAFDGPVAFEVEERVAGGGGRTRRVPAWRIAGEDSRLDPDGSARLLGARMERLDGGLRVASPQLRLPLDPEGQGLSLAEGRPWILESPELEIPGVLGGRRFRLIAPEVELDPDSRALRADGPFRLEGPGLLLEGTGLRYDPATGILHFGEEDGRLQGRLEGRDGGIHGFGAAAGGRLEPREGGQRLLLPGGGEGPGPWLSLPASSGLKGIFRTGGLRVDLAAEEPGTALEEVRGAAPTAFEGPSERFWGETSRLLFRDGRVDAWILEGPVLAWSGGGERGWSGWLRGGGPASYEPGRDLFSLAGGVTAWGDTGFLEAGWLRVQGGERHAGGGVFARTPEGAVRCEELHPLAGGAWRILGPAVLYPAGGDGFLEAAAAEEITYDPGGETRLRGEVRVRGRREGESWSLQADALDLTGERVDARGSIVWMQGENRLAGSSLYFRDPSQAELRGSPARAVLGLEEGNGATEASAARMVFAGGRPILDGGPSIEVPAEAFGMSGPPVVVQARLMRQLEDGTWELLRDVRFSGSLSAGADEARWTPGGELLLLGKGNPVRVRGLREEGRSLEMGAREELRLRPDGEVRLREDAWAVLRSLPAGPGDEGEAGAAERSGETAAAGPREDLRIRGDEAAFGRRAGWFEGGVRFESPAQGLRGAADRVEWSEAPGASVLRLLGGADLEHPEARARAAVVEYRPEEELLLLQGSPEAPARLERPDGSVFLGEWVRFDLSLGLPESGPGRLLDAGPPRRRPAAEDEEEGGR